MELLTLLALAVIIGTITYSFVKEVNFSLVGSVTCFAVFILLVMDAHGHPVIFSDLFWSLGFMHEDLLDPGRFHTILTSMFTHASFFHIFMNVLALAFLGMILEQRIGTRRYILLFLFTGLCGTLTFAAFRWYDPAVMVVGASGAISGIMGALVRLYPQERMMLMFLPGITFPLWMIVFGFLLIQLVVLMGDYGVAVESHLGGLVAGMVVAPYIQKVQVRGREKREISVVTLRKLATTPELRSMLAKIEQEEISDVRSAWIETFLSSAKCPVCGAQIISRKEGLFCERGHML